MNIPKGITAGNMLAFFYWGYTLIALTAIPLNFVYCFSTDSWSFLNLFNNYFFYISFSFSLLIFVHSFFDVFSFGNECNQDYYSLISAISCNFCMNLTYKGMVFNFISWCFFLFKRRGEFHRFYNLKDSRPVFRRISGTIASTTNLVSYTPYYLYLWSTNNSEFYTFKGETICYFLSCVFLTFLFNNEIDVLLQGLTLTIFWIYGFGNVYLRDTQNNWNVLLLIFLTCQFCLTNMKLNNGFLSFWSNFLLNSLPEALKKKIFLKDQVFCNPLNGNKKCTSNSHFSKTRVNKGFHFHRPYFNYGYLKSSFYDKGSCTLVFYGESYIISNEKSSMMNYSIINNCPFCEWRVDVPLFGGFGHCSRIDEIINSNWEITEIESPCSFYSWDINSPRLLCFLKNDTVARLLIHNTEFFGKPSLNVLWASLKCKRASLLRKLIGNKKQKMYCSQVNGIISIQTKKRNNLLYSVEMSNCPADFIERYKAIDESSYELKYGKEFSISKDGVVLDADPEYEIITSLENDARKNASANVIHDDMIIEFELGIGFIKESQKIDFLKNGDYDKSDKRYCPKAKRIEVVMVEDEDEKEENEAKTIDVLLKKLKKGVVSSDLSLLNSSVKTLDDLSQGRGGNSTFYKDIKNLLLSRVHMRSKETHESLNDLILKKEKSIEVFKNNQDNSKNRKRIREELKKINDLKTKSGDFQGFLSGFESGGYSNYDRSWITAHPLTKYRIRKSEKKVTPPVETSNMFDVLKDIKSEPVNSFEKPEAYWGHLREEIKRKGRVKSINKDFKKVFLKDQKINVKEFLKNGEEKKLPLRHCKKLLETCNFLEYFSVNKLSKSSSCTNLNSYRIKGLRIKEAFSLKKSLWDFAYKIRSEEKEGVRDSKNFMSNPTLAVDKARNKSRVVGRDEKGNVIYSSIDKDIETFSFKRKGMEYKATMIPELIQLICSQGETKNSLQ